MNLCNAKIFFVFIILSLFLSGCGKKTDNEFSHLTFAIWGSQSEIKIIKPLIAEFENQYNVKVELMHIPQNYFQKLHLLFASKQAPDVFFINNYYLPIYAGAGLLTDLEPYFSGDFNNKYFFKNTLNSLSYNGKQYAIPRDVSNLVVYYNKNIFDKHKVSYPNDNWSYSELLETAKALTNKENWGIGFEEQPLFWSPVLRANCGRLFDENGDFALNEPRSKQALKFYMDLRNTNKTAPTRIESANRTMAQMFLDEKIAMQISGRWLVPKYRSEADFDWDIAQMPCGECGCISGSDSSGWAISSSAKDKELAAKFVEFLSSKNSIKKMTESGLITPARKDVAYSNAFLDNKKPKNAAVFIKSNETAAAEIIPQQYNQKIEKLMRVLEPYFTGAEKINQNTTFEL